MNELNNNNNNNNTSSSGSSGSGSGSGSGSNVSGMVNPSQQNYHLKKRSSVSFGSYRNGNDAINTKLMDRNALYSNSNFHVNLSLMPPLSIQEQQQLLGQQQLQQANGVNGYGQHGYGNVYGQQGYGYGHGNAYGYGQQGYVSNKPLCSYQSKSPLYGLDWSSNTAFGDLVCLGSYKEDNLNNLQILHNTNSTGGFPEWSNVCQQKTLFPVSKIQWDPHLSFSNNSMNETSIQKANLATCSDSLRIWTLQNSTTTGDDINPNVSGTPTHTPSSNGNSIHNNSKNKSKDGLGNETEYVLNETLNLSLWKYYNKQGVSGVTPVGGSAKVLGTLPPVTSCDWNKKDPSIIISSSIDTTCTVWDLNRVNVKTQLIAHDSEVFDVKFLTNSTHLFATCGNDGSARVFDLRSLEHSSIIYEPSEADISSSTVVDYGQAAGNGGANGSVDSVSRRNKALLRLETCPFDINVVATFANNSNSVIVLDMRYPGQPVTILKNHGASINSIKWHPSKKGILTSCSDDCQVLVWDTKKNTATNLNIGANTSGGDISMNSRTSSASSTSASSSLSPDHASPPRASSVSGSSVVAEDTYINGVSYPSPILCYNDNIHEEINNITWRGGQSNGDWLGFVRGKSFQSIKC